MSKELAVNGFLNERGKPYAAKSVASMCGRLDEVFFGSLVDITGPFTSCPLYPQQRTFVGAVGMSEKCQKADIGDRSIRVSLSAPSPNKGNYR
jgi:hypothetical protein